MHGIYIYIYILDFIEEFELKSQFSGSTTQVESQLNHI
jgi:hypothetical protein